MEDKNNLSQGLAGQDSRLHVCRCTTEADFCIGHGATSGSIAISSDSDLLIYPNVTSLVRPLPKKHHAYGIYEREQVLEALGLPTPQHLVLYGIVTSNDYSNNIPGLGPVNNTDIIRSIDGNETVKKMLDKYILAAAAFAKPGVSVDAKMFQPSLR
ncbi:hypothetical protein BGX34_008396, partial [Mortierella sp. NVP85]